MLDFILVKNRKIIFLAVLVLMTSTFLSACIGVDLFYGTRPFDYPDSLWVCEEPHITLKVSSNNLTTAYFGDEENGTTFDLAFGYGRNVVAFESGAEVISDDTILFRGDCRFAEDHFAITLSEDNVWDGKYTTLYFTRER